MHHDKFYFSVYITFFPNVAELILNTIFSWFKIEVKCKKINRSKKSFNSRYIGQILILPKYSIEILGKYGINLQNCDTIISSDKMVFIDEIEKIVYRCSTNELGSVGIVNNYNYLTLAKFSNTPKPIFIQKNDCLTISAESLMNGAGINIKDVTSEMFAEIIKQINPLYNINRTIRHFDLQNELDSYDKYFEYYCPLWVDKLVHIKHLITSNIDLPPMENIYACKTLIHGDLTYRNVLLDNETFLFYDFDRSEISYPEFDIYLFYIDWLTHASQPNYKVLFKNIFKFINDEIHLSSIELLDYANPNFKMNLDIAYYLKFIFLYRMLVLSLQNFNSNNTYPIKILDMIIKELEV
ncbi:hypothetical protein EO98_01360 [Methanosarcina sp. 2.H.T.1A.6]|uniref:phosphotransferase n=1 Tax=unclassified Methanosarcina TaxID=2644672 RepID=UPI0006217CC5|nr:MULTISPECIES: phosphotransferase [unclassified Methanosarcina]KKG14920.1 hypothetical protein EO94_13425 [Methanosarcina sp. 2.H.T.1A.3]KKG21046.1 hypothetical protein EO98_01360 [Methanosarcina sp. 2.H.T.1A.6]KKG21227.1 hypothetical protein EO97_01825 [Methanosarcina sp. 2.H.T.1A.15]KKG27295.1 hypothetical protein EO96_10195 [Methanosarcina sp. 2.H.T.1A.8]